MPSHAVTHRTRLPAVILAATCLCAGTSAAQSGADIPRTAPDPQARIGGKSPGLALTFSLLLPGSGQVYNGQHMKGLLHFAAGLATTWAAVSGFSSGDCQGESYRVWNAFSERYVTRWTEGGACSAGYIALAANMGVRVWSMLDARGNATAINRRLAMTFRPVVLATQRGVPRLGINLLELGL